MPSDRTLPRVMTLIVTFGLRSKLDWAKALETSVEEINHFMSGWSTPSPTQLRIIQEYLGTRKKDEFAWVDLRKKFADILKLTPAKANVKDDAASKFPTLGDYLSS